MTRLEIVEQNRSRLHRELDALEAEKYQLLMEKHGIEVGMLVESLGKVYKVLRGQHLDWNTPWLLGNPRLKDGTFGKQERTIYTPWKRITE